MVYVKLNETTTGVLCVDDGRGIYFRKQNCMLQFVHLGTIPPNNREPKCLSNTNILYKIGGDNYDRLVLTYIKLNETTTGVCGRQTRDLS